MRSLLENRTLLIDYYYKILSRNTGELPEYEGCIYRYDEDKDNLIIVRMTQRVDEKGEIKIPLGFDYFDESVTFVNRKNLIHINFGSIKAIKFNTSNKFPKSLVSVRGDFVEELGAKTFYDLYNLKTVNMRGLESIGFSCFSGCKALKSITVENVKSIEDYAFLECNSLISIDLESLEYSSACEVFAHSGLVHFKAENLIGLDNSFFAHANHLSYIYTPKLANIGKGMLKACIRLKHCEFGILDFSVFNNYLTEENYLDKNMIKTGKDVFDVYTRNSNELFLKLPSIFSLNTFLNSNELVFKFTATDFEVASLIVQFVTLAYIVKDVRGGTLAQNTEIKHKFLSCYKDGKFLGLKNIRFEVQIIKE